MSAAKDTASLAFDEAQAINTRAAKAELDHNYAQAFPLYLKAAEGFLHASRTSTGGRSRTIYQAAARRALERAEKIKAAKRDLEPVAVDVFSEQEQYRVLLKSSRINEYTTTIWDGSANIEPSFDADRQPELSSPQIQASATWLPAAAVFPCSSLISSLLPHDLIQLIVEDCSVVASLSICLAHHNRFKSKLGLASLFPQDAAGFPCLSQTAYYSLRILFNGVHRCVAIDDHLPFSEHEKELLCMSTGVKHVLWPSLVEKAYMKLMGGYTFPGSALTGWIPDHIQIKSPTFEREKTWHRVVQGFLKGHCVLTVGTSEGQQKEWCDIELLPAHCYSVIDIREHEGKRSFVILDPTANGGKKTARQLEVQWDEVCDIFESLYLSWDPGLFEHSIVFHGMWKTGSTVKNDNDQSLHASLRVVCPSKGDRGLTEMWVLLTRHVVDSRRIGEFICLQVESDEDGAVTKETDALSHVVLYTSSTHVLARVALDASCSSLNILACYDGQFSDVGFTITCYSPYPLAWDKRIPAPPYTTQIFGSIANTNNGGRSTLSTYMINPQYHLRIHPDNRSSSPSCHEKPKVTLMLHGPKNVPLSVCVAWSQGGRIFDATKKETAAASGPYRYGLARLSQYLPVGDYTVIISAYDTSYMGKFSMSVESTHRFDIENIPQEGAGMYTKTAKGAWDSQTAAGGPSFGRYTSNPLFELEVASPTQIIVRLQLINHSSSAPLNISLFHVNCLPGAPSLLGREVATSGPYTDSVAGAAIPRVNVARGRYLLLPSTHAPGVESPFRIVVYSTTVIKLTIST